jgi:hypothetical protein
MATSDPLAASSLEETIPECSAYRGYTGALAKATIDCLGTVGPFLYGVNEKGLLERRFDACTSGGTNRLESPGLLRIDRLLSLQLRQATLPNVLKCIPQAYERAQRAFVQRGYTTCPMWKHEAARGLPTLDSVRTTAQALSRLLRRGPDGVRVYPALADQAVNVSDLAETFHLYTVRFASDASEHQPCGSPEACARACTSVFAGFYVGMSENQIVGDPYEWLDPTVYDDWRDSDPYRVKGYYHPMSFAGGPDDFPGPIYGDIARAKFSEVIDASGNPVVSTDPDNEAELCSRWDGTDHRIGRMVQDRFPPDRPDLWLSVCEFWPTTFGDPFAYSWP